MATSVSVAEPLSVSSSVTRYQIAVQFAPKGERKPLTYELLHGVPVFNAQINGEKVWAMVDDRVTRSVIDARFAKSHGLKLAAASGQFKTPNGRLERQIASDVSINIPGQMSVQTNFSAVDLSFAEKVAGRPISLIVGKEYFDDLEFLFTPGNQHIQLGPSATLHLPADTPGVALVNDRPQIETTINGQPAILTVDLGYQGSVALTDAAWKRLGLISSGLEKTATLDGKVGKSKITSISEVQLGSVLFRDVRALSIKTLADDGDGYVGFALLSRYNFALDMKGRHLWLISKAN